MANQNFNHNPEVEKDDYGDFEKALLAQGYDYLHTTDAMFHGYRIWPVDKEDRWSQHLSHLGLYTTKGKGENIIITHGRCTVRFGSMFGQKGAQYNHTNLTGPKVANSPLRNSMNEKILKRICDSYITDDTNTKVSDTEKDKYRRIVRDGYPEYLQEWQDLLDTVEVRLRAMYWSDPPDWSLRAKGQNEQPEE